MVVTTKSAIGENVSEAPIESIESVNGIIIVKSRNGETRFSKDELDRINKAVKKA